MNGEDGQSGFNKEIEDMQGSITEAYEAMSDEDKAAFIADNPGVSLDNNGNLVFADIDPNNAKMLGLLDANGMLTEDQLQSFMLGGTDTRDQMMVEGVTAWLNNPDATGKEMFTANMIYQSMEGKRDGSLGILNLQDAAVMFGSKEDGHINMFYDNLLSADSLAMVNDMYEQMYEDGTLSEDDYLDRCEELEDRAYLMSAMGNEAHEIMVGLDFLEQDFQNDYGKTPEQCLEEFCNEYNKTHPEGMSYEDLMDHINHPENYGDDAYRWPWVNGEMDDEVPDEVLLDLDFFAPNILSLKVIG
jgi:hypothetical protein